MKETMKLVTDNFGNGTDLVFEQEAAVPEQPVAQEPTDTVSEPEPETPIAQAQSTPEPEHESKPTRSASNFKALKEQTARLAKERDEMRALLEQMQQQRIAQPQQSSMTDDIDIDPDAYAEGKHVKKLVSEIRSMKEELSKSRAQTQAMAIKATLVAEHPDFEKVVTRENLTALEVTYPHLAKAINTNDPYTAGKACYDLIKQFGIDQDDAQESTITKAIIAQNMAKPKVAPAVKGGRPTNESTMGRASEFYTGELTDQMKKQFHKELQDAMKGYGGYKP